MDATAVAVAAVAGLVALGTCRWRHFNGLPKVDRSDPAAQSSELETAPAAVRLQQARGRPSPWHWRRTNSAGAGVGAALLSAADKGAALAALPSREELLAKLMGTMQAPVAKFVQTLNEVPSKFVRGLAAVRDQK